MEDKILLPNRYGRKIYLTKIESGKYQVKLDESWLNFYITGTNPIKMIDWDGADPICVGDKMEPGVVSKITFEDGIEGVCIYFEDET